MRLPIRTALVAADLLAFPVIALGPGVRDRAKNAVDPDCTVGKAARGAVARSTVGVGNRCVPAETARDVTGVDGKKGNRNGPLKSRDN
jgi:hypothetical protein